MTATKENTSALWAYTVNDRRIEHRIHTMTDTVYVFDENGGVLFTIDRSADVYRNGTLIGRFRMSESPAIWNYKGLDGRVMKPQSLTLILAEVEVMKVLVAELFKGEKDGTQG